MFKDRSRKMESITKIQERNDCSFDPNCVVGGSDLRSALEFLFEGRIGRICCSLPWTLHVSTFCL